MEKLTAAPDGTGVTTHFNDLPLDIDAEPETLREHAEDLVRLAIRTSTIAASYATELRQCRGCEVDLDATLELLDMIAEQSLHARMRALLLSHHLVDVRSATA